VLVASIKQASSRGMFRFVGFKSTEQNIEHGTVLLLDKVPEKKDLQGEYKISRFCNGFVGALSRVECPSLVFAK
jgi:hypothetical protein